MVSILVIRHLSVHGCFIYVLINVKQSCIICLFRLRQFPSLPPGQGELATDQFISTVFILIIKHISNVFTADELVGNHAITNGHGTITLYNDGF